MPRVELPDPVKLLIGFYESRVDADVYGGVPKPRPDVFVTVERTGGPVLNRVMEQPQVTLGAWAGSKAAAFELAGSLTWFLLNDRAGLPLVRRVDVLSTYWDPDPDSKHARVSVLLQLTTRATRKTS